ncbi:MAG: hypothetical protein U1D55_19345 [Phycisphaerae bacterium]
MGVVVLPDAAVRGNDHWSHDLRHEPVDLSRRHQPGEVRLGLQERLPAIGHQIVHVVHRLHGDALQGFPEALPLALTFGNLPRDRSLGERLDFGIDQDTGQPGEHLVRFGDFGLEPGRLRPVRFKSLRGHRRHFLQHTVHVIEHGRHGGLDSGQELVLPHCPTVVAGIGSDALPPAAAVIDVLAFVILALPGVVDVAAFGAEQVPRERPQFGHAARKVHCVRGKLRLCPLERRIVNQPQRFVTLDRVPVHFVVLRNAPTRCPVQLEAPTQEPDFADQHPVDDDAADSAAAPRAAETCRNAAFPQAVGNLPESHRLREVRLKDEPYGFGLFRMDRQSLLSIFAGDDAVAVGRRPAGAG